MRLAPGPFLLSHSRSAASPASSAVRAASAHRLSVTDARWLRVNGSKHRWNLHERSHYEHPYSEAAGLPVNEAQPIIAFSPVVFDVPGRLAPLEVKVTAPVHGERLPVILLSHGHGASNFLSSLHGYAPVAEFWAAHGLVVIQPTHLDSTALGFQDADDPQAPLFWRSRAEDMLFILDHLADVE